MNFTLGARYAAATARRIEAAAVAAASKMLATRIAVAAPDVTVTPGTSEVRLTAPGLVARLFGSRRRGPDPRLLAVLGDGR